ncbi:hypothetical protein EYF80_029239 [Liparis tanakae]|uniref:Uncharacterized protein n=1 Tax=Liparis tanakae TaxID=230148 RepID=A0A4Z2H3Y3_9TELE|nr:hypothetical protein EYF80_029239 [Liparis tanakae]
MESTHTHRRTHGPVLRTTRTRVSAAADQSGPWPWEASPGGGKQRAHGITKQRGEYQRGEEVLTQRRSTSLREERRGAFLSRRGGREPEENRRRTGGEPEESDGLLEMAICFLVLLESFSQDVCSPVVSDAMPQPLRVNVPMSKALRMG